MVIVDQIIFVCGFHLEQIHSSSSSTETIRSSPVSHLLNNIPQTLDFEFSPFFYPLLSFTYDFGKTIAFAIRQSPAGHACVSLEIVGAVD